MKRRMKILLLLASITASLVVFDGSLPGGPGGGPGIWPESGSGVFKRGVFPFANTAQAAGRLTQQEIALPGAPVHVATFNWFGGPALSVVAREGARKEKRGYTLRVLLLDPDGFSEVARWPLPKKTKYVEPLRLPGGGAGWLVLVSGKWNIASTRKGKLLQWKPLCACRTIFSYGGTPHKFKHRFVYDLNGDGVDEVVLPYTTYLEAYRLVPSYLAPEPIWRVYWNQAKRPLAQKGGGRGFVLPEFLVREEVAPGQRGLVLKGEDGLLVAHLPKLVKVATFSLDARKKALLLRSDTFKAWPESLQRVIRILEGSVHRGPKAFLDSLFRRSGAVKRDQWAPHLGSVLQMARATVPVQPLYKVPFPGLGPFDKEEDRRLVLAAQDMDGDGVMDILHATLRDFGSVFSQSNHLLWYRGRFDAGKLTFDPPGRSFRTDAGSFAEVVISRTDGRPPQALLLATTEVSFGSVMQALASQQVELNIKILPWSEGTLAATPATDADFTFRELREKGRRPMFLSADLNGDGLRDYLLNPHADRLTIFLTRDGRADLKRKPLVHAGVVLPSKPEQVLITDLDQNGAEELVLWYRESQHGERAWRIAIVRMLE